MCKKEAPATLWNDLWTSEMSFVSNFRSMIDSFSTQDSLGPYLFSFHRMISVYRREGPFEQELSENEISRQCLERCSNEEELNEDNRRKFSSLMDDFIQSFGVPL